MSIHRMQDKLSEAEKLLEEYRLRVSENPDSFAHKLQFNSFQNHVEELKKQLEIEITLSHNELIELRFKGTSVDEGKIPLHLLGVLAEKIHKAFGFLGFKAANPKSKSDKFTPDINLELIDLKYGSCKLYVVGHSTRDALHFSQTTDAFFEILNHDLTQPIANLSKKYGGKSLYYIGQMLEEMSKNNVTAEFSMPSINKNNNFWNGKYEIISGLENKIKQIHEEVTTINISGLVYLIDKSGELGIHEQLTEKKFKNYKIKFDSEQYLNDIKKITIDSLISVTLQRKTILQDSLSKDKYQYTLLEITELPSL